MNQNQKANKMKIDQDSLYVYKSELDRVVDGDTVDLIVNLGFNSFRKERIRLWGIDAPERFDRPAGPNATKFLTDLITGNPIFLKSHKDKRGKYGRFLGKLFIEQDGELLDVNQHMIDEGHAKTYMAR